ncbi:MAG: V-type ATP synthase subunit E [Candidatus Nanohaloarchaea archaeon]
MGLEDVKSDILNDAEEEAERIVQEAKNEKEEIIEEAREEADKIRENVQDEIEKEKESMESEALSNARMEARNRKLQAQQEVLEQVFSDFREELSELSDSEREQFLQTCLDKTEFEIGEVQGSPGFRDLVDESFQEIDSEGVILVSEDGSMRRNFTFDKIVEQYRDEYRKEVAEELLGEER